MRLNYYIEFKETSRSKEKCLWYEANSESKAKALFKKEYPRGTITKMCPSFVLIDDDLTEIFKDADTVYVECVREAVNNVNGVDDKYDDSILALHDVLKKNPRVKKIFNKLRKIIPEKKFNFSWDACHALANIGYL